MFFSLKRKSLMRAIVLFFIVFNMIYVNIQVQAAEKKPVSKYGIIYIGDSRTVGLDNTIGMSNYPNTFVIAKVGEGLNYLKNTAEPKIESIISSHPEITIWKVISSFGINDLANIEGYKDEYAKMSKKYDLILQSVNPVEYHKSITNDKVKAFNAELIATELPYIDTYTDMIEEGYSTTDGVHFSKETYRREYPVITAGILASEKEKFVSESKDNL